MQINRYSPSSATRTPISFHVLAQSFPAEFARPAIQNNSPDASGISSFMQSLFSAATGHSIDYADDGIRITNAYAATLPMLMNFAKGLQLSHANRGRKSIMAPSQLKALFSAASSTSTVWPKKWLVNGEAWLNLQGIYG